MPKWFIPAHYAALEAQRVEVEAALKGELVWHNPSNTRMCRVSARRVVDLNDRSQWPEYLDWLVNELNEFYQFFRPLVRNLEP